MVGHLLEAGGEPVGVLRPHRGEGAEHDEIERALQQLDARSLFTGHRSGDMPRAHWRVKWRAQLAEHAVQCRRPTW